MTTRGNISKIIFNVFGLNISIKRKKTAEWRKNTTQLNAAYKALQIQ